MSIEVNMIKLSVQSQRPYFCLHSIQSIVLHNIWNNVICCIPIYLNVYFDFCQNQCLIIVLTTYILYFIFNINRLDIGHVGLACRHIYKRVASQVHRARIRPSSIKYFDENFIRNYYSGDGNIVHSRAIPIIIWIEYYSFFFSFSMYLIHSFICLLYPYENVIQSNV